MPYIFTCEHGGNRIPPRYRHLFKGQARALTSHLGWDRGALQLARACARDCTAPLYFSQVSRLLIDLNRSRHHRALFSVFSGRLDQAQRQAVCDSYYFPYRKRVESAISEEKRRPVIHLSFHSFTHELDGRVRNGDIGLLYDPANRLEMEFCIDLQSELKRNFPQLVVRRNYPYRGSADGFTTYLRKRFPQQTYLGIEIEINQKHVGPGKRGWRRLLDKFGGILNHVSGRFFTIKPGPNPPTQG